MGVKLACKKSGNAVYLGGGFECFRNRLARLSGQEFGDHYAKLSMSEVLNLTGEQADAFYEHFDNDTQVLVDQKLVNLKVAWFCLQDGQAGRAPYGACKEIYKLIKDYDDEFIYGYAGQPNPARFADIKAIILECIEKRCDLVWS